VSQNPVFNNKNEPTQEEDVKNQIIKEESTQIIHSNQNQFLSGSSSDPWTKKGF